MKFRIFTLAVLTAISAIFISCSQEPADKNENGTAVQFEAAMATRAYDGSWQAGDGIGLAMLGTDNGAIVGDVFNYNYYTPSAAGFFEPRVANKTIYYPQDGSSVTFKGYYPFHDNLARDMLMPLNVVSQAALPAIDFMTTRPAGTFSKDDNVVHLVFQHRLSKLIFDLNIADGEPAFPLEDLTLDIKGMYTSGNYDMLGEKLTVDNTSMQDIIVPYINIPSARNAIVLPRPAGEGVVFEFTNKEGGKYIAFMDPDLELKSGYKYTFHITLKRTAAIVTAEIEEWLDGGSYTYDIVQVGGAVGNNENINQGDRMKVYMGGTGNNFSLLSTFTFTSAGTWNPDPVVLWDDMPDPVRLRASMTAEPALNQSQLPDILIAPEISVARYAGAHFNFKHALAKTIVTLESSDPGISALLANAVVTLPQYISGGYESNGTFIYGDGSTHSDIRAEKMQVSGATAHVALLEPQTISQDGLVLRINIGTTAYNVNASTGAVAYRAGFITHINVRISASDVNFSAAITDWTDTDPIDLNALALTVSPPESVNIPDGAELELYRHTPGGIVLLSTYTYDEGTGKWTPSPEVIWEDLEDQETFHGSLFVHDKYNGTQLDDYFTSEPVTVQKNNGLFLELTHPAAKVTVQLKSTIYSPEELALVTVVLPQYIVGGSYTDGVFTRGQGTTGDIDLYYDGVSMTGVIDPQTRIAGNVVAEVNTPATNTHAANTYRVMSSGDIEFKPGYNTILVITINESDFIISARLTDWQTEEAIPLVPDELQIGGQREDTDKDFQGQTIYIYKMGTPIIEYGYSYTQKPSGWSWEGPTLYWDDLQVSTANPLTLTGLFFPHPTLKPTASPIQQNFAWNLPVDQANGYQDYDILSSNLTITTPQYINFMFRHTLSKVRVVLTSKEFELNELKGSKIALNGFVMNGNIDLNTGTAVPGNTEVTITPYTESDGQVYSALVMPGTAFTTTDNIVSITLPGYPNTPFQGKLSNPVTLVAGAESVITINLKKTGIEISAKYETWSNGPEGYIEIQ